MRRSGVMFLTALPPVTGGEEVPLLFSVAALRERNIAMFGEAGTGCESEA
jgi:hypothetical protein